MLLSTYITQVQNLLQNPPAPTTLYATSVVTVAINLARQQIAGEGFCCKQMITGTINPATVTYPLASVSFAASTGINGILHVNQMWVSDAGFNKWIVPRPWEWYSLFSNFNNAAAQPGIPNVWSQYSQGVTGVVYFDPVPDNIYPITIDATCIPTDLTSVATVEAIPYPYTDCVQFLSAYYVLLSAQSSARQDDANRMYARYKEFLERAHRMSTGGVLPYQYDTSPEAVGFDKLRAHRNALGGVPGGGGQQQ